MIANAFLEAEIDRLSAAVSSGFARGKVRKAPTSKEIKEKKRTDDVQTAEEASMAVTYYVALPFIRTDDGTAPAKHRSAKAAYVMSPFGSPGADRLRCARVLNIMGIDPGLRSRRA